MNKKDTSLNRCLGRVKHGKRLSEANPCKGFDLKSVWGHQNYPEFNNYFSRLANVLRWLLQVNLTKSIFELTYLQASEIFLGPEFLYNVRQNS